jgi:aminoglycoside 6-adenylyltransferase
MNHHNHILDNIIRWGQAEEAVRALVLVGSRARAQHTPADELADYDVQVYVTGANPCLQNDAWLSRIGKVWVCIADQYDWNGLCIPTRLAIYEDGVKVDYSFYPWNKWTNIAGNDIMNRGCLILLDKDNITMNKQESPFQKRRQNPPDGKEYQHAVSEFWFEAYHVAKYLKRNELWLVKFRDWATKELLLKMIEWNARAKHGGEIDTCFMGKNMQAWVDAETWQALHAAFGRFDRQDSWNALLATMDLFRRLATETADLLRFTYPQEIDRNLTGFILSLKDNEETI